jgi:hypothetical protein
VDEANFLWMEPFFLWMELIFCGWIGLWMEQFFLWMEQTFCGCRNFSVDGTIKIGRKTRKRGPSVGTLR